MTFPLYRADAPILAQMWEWIHVEEAENYGFALVSFVRVRVRVRVCILNFY